MNDKLRKIIEEDLRNYENKGFNDEDKAKCLGIIAKEECIIFNEEKLKLEVEKNKHQEEVDKERLDFEKQKAKYQIEIETEKLKLERDRFEHEKLNEANRQLEENKKSKQQFILSIVSISAPILLGIISKIIYAGLAINAQKHDYNDYQIESSYSKEQRNNLLK